MPRGTYQLHGGVIHEHVLEGDVCVLGHVFILLGDLPPQNAGRQHVRLVYHGQTLVAEAAGLWSDGVVVAVTHG